MPPSSTILPSRSALRNAGAKGHSGKLIVPTWKRREIEGDPFQIKWRKENSLFWDAKARTYVDESLIAGKEISSTHRMDFFYSMRFAAKVALGGAYFIYGDLIRTCVDCDELRRLISFDRKKRETTLNFSTQL